jgi:Tfp pilus assembly protein PilZ
VNGNPEDRRRHPRYDLNLVTQMEVEVKDGTVEEYQMATVNISAGGLFFRTKRRIAAGMPVRAEIFLPVESPDLPSRYRAGILIMVSGSVLAPRPDGVAVQFDEDYGIEGRLKRLTTEPGAVLH